MRSQQTVAFTDAPDELARIPRGANVYVETFPLSNDFALADENVQWRSLHKAIDGDDETLTLEVTLDAARLSASHPRRQHFAEVAELLHPDKRVRLAIPRGSDPPLVMFQGWPQTRTLQWSASSQVFTCQCLCEIQERIRGDANAQVIGRMMRKHPWINPESVPPGDVLFSDLHRVMGLPAVFNANGQPNRLVSYRNVAQVLEMATPDRAGSDQLWVFADDNSPEAGYWNFASAMRYLAKLYLEPAGVHCIDFLADTADLHNLDPGADPDPFRSRMRARPEKTPVASMHAENAFKVLCDAADLHFAWETIQDALGAVRWRLVVFAQVRSQAEETATRERLMNAPFIGEIPRDEPFTDYGGLQPGDIARRNEAQSSHVTIDSRIAPSVTVIGGIKRHEVTLLLRPGWHPHPRLDNLTTAEQVASAEEFWDRQLGFDQEERDEDTGRPFSPYHAAHPQHYKKIKDFNPALEPGENPLAGEAVHPNDDTFAMIGRLWVFPDNFDYVDIDGETSPYARSSGPWNDAKFYRPYLNWPWPTSGPTRHVMSDDALGGGVADWDLNTAVLRRRILGNLIGRANQATTDRSPIVRFNFTATNPMTALADRNWIEVAGAAVLDRTRAALWITAENLANDPRLRAQPDDPEMGILLSLLGKPLEVGGAIVPRFFVALTCTIESDFRLSTVAGSTAPGIISRTTQALVDTGLEQFTFRARGNSHLAGVSAAETDPAFKPRSDQEQLQRYAGREVSRIGRETIAGNWEAPYIKTDLRLGDGFSGIAGLGINFTSYPMIVAVDYSNDPKAGLRTTYHLSDMRHALDSGVEV